MRNRYLVRRADTYYFRLRVPDDLRQHYPRREIMRSLRTTDRAVAAPLALALAAQNLQRFNELRMAKGNRVDLKVIFTFGPDGGKALEFDDVQPGDIETVKTLARELAGDAAAPAAPVTPPKQQQTPLLSEAVAEFIQRAEKSGKDSMLRKHKGCLPVFVELVGDVRLHELKQRALNQFFLDICRLPSTWHLIRNRENLTVRQIIERDWPGLDLLGPKSFKATWRPSISRFLSWAKATYHDDGFPVGLTLEEATYAGDRAGDENKQRAFQPDELKRLFEGDEARAFAQNPDEHHKYWLPLICLFTGSRINEVAQLNPQTDIKQDATGIWHFELSEETEAAEGLRKSIKTGTTRLVPIHGKLIELGFIDYVERIKADGHKLLFPAWSKIEDGKIRQPGRWLTKHLREIGLYGAENDAGRAVRGAHAFRHTFLSYGAALGLNLEILTHKVPANQSSVVAGYLDATITRNLGREKEMIDRLDYKLSFPAPVSV